MILRPRQIEFVEKSVAALKKYNNTVSVAFTGASKTICLSAVIKRLIAEGIVRKALIIAHRDEITYQNQDKFLKVAPDITTSLFNADSKYRVIYVDPPWSYGDECSGMGVLWNTIRL